MSPRPNLSWKRICSAK